MAGKRFHKEMGDYLKERKRDKTEIKIKFKAPAGRKKEERKSPYEPGVVDLKPGGRNFIDDVIEKIQDFFVGSSHDAPVKEELTPEEKERLREMTSNKSNPKKKEVQVEEDVDEEFGDLDVPKPSFMDRVFSFFGLGEPEYRELEEFDPEEYDIEKTQKRVEDQYKDDVKELIKISHKWLEQLSARKRKEFKQSEDFENYKELLAKLNLLKEKKTVEKELKDVGTKKKK